MKFVISFYPLIFEKKQALLIFIIAFIVGGNLLWVNLNSTPPFFDSAGHTNLAFVYADIFTGERKASVVDFLTVSDYYPPLPYILGGIAGIFGQDYKILQFSSVLLLGFTTILLYLYTKELTDNSKWAFFSAAIFIFLPQIWEQSRYFMLDLPLTTFVILALFSLERFNKGKGNKYLYLGFFLASLAQLVKWYAWVYLSIPFLFSLYRYLKYSFNRRKTLVSIGILILGSLILILPWYLVNLQSLFFWSKLTVNPDFADPTNLLSLRNLIFYPTILLNYQIVSLQFIFLIFACFLFFKDKPAERLLFALQILFVYLVFTFFGNKNLRYTLPLLPFLAVIMGYGAIKLFNMAKIGKVFTAGLFVFNILFFLINSFSFPLTANFRAVIDLNKVNKNLDNLYLMDFTNRDIPYRFSQSEWSADTVVTDVSRQGLENKTKVLVVANNPYVSVATLNLFNRNKRQILFEDLPPDLVRTIRGQDIEAVLANYDFILVPDQVVATLAQVNYFNLDEIRKYLLAGKTRDFALIKTYRLPNGDALYLLRKDENYNSLQVSIEKDSLKITRPKAIANVYLQFMTSDFKWSQETILQHQTSFDKDLRSFVRFRIDYPPRLIKTGSVKGWKYDQDKQFDKE